MTPQELLDLKIDGYMTLHELLRLAECEGQLVVVDYEDSEDCYCYLPAYIPIAQKIIDAIKGQT